MFNLFNKRKKQETVSCDTKPLSRDLEREFYCFLRGFVNASSIKGEVISVTITDESKKGYNLDLVVSNQSDTIGIGGRNVATLCAELQKEFDCKFRVNVVQGVI